MDDPDYLPPILDSIDWKKFPDVEAWITDQSGQTPAPPPRRINELITPPKGQTPEQRELHARDVYGVITTIVIPRRFRQVWGNKVLEQDYQQNQAKYIQGFRKQDPVARDWYRAVIRLMKRAGIKEW